MFKYLVLISINILIQYGFANQLSNASHTISNKNNANRYSIIDDLRLSFETFSYADINYHEFLARENIQINRFDSYKSFLDSIDTCCELDTLKYNINSFDINYLEIDSKQLKAIESKALTPNHDIKGIQNKQIKKQRNDNKLNIAMLSPQCENRRFNIKKEVRLSNKEILYALAKECNFSIQYQQSSKFQSNTNNVNMINIKNKKLDFIIPILLHDSFYSIESNKLIIKDIDMQIFDMNYISSTRMAQSNTDVLFSQEQQDNFYGGFYTTGYNNYLNNNVSYAQNNVTQNNNISGYLDNLSLRNQLRSQMSNANSRFGKSGTKIYSIDEINFWADIESKLLIMLDSKSGDKFMIDKGAGLISVWTTKAKMKEVKRFLTQLEEKMNLQVLLDVEILSLTHFKTSNVGIDWQSIFSILNPNNSQLNLSFGSGIASLTIRNDVADLNSIFNLLKTYGELRSLSNPKIMALNNQPAIISVGSVLRYTQNFVFQSNNTNTAIQNTSTQYPSVFAGILLDITPSINKDSIILRINPSITKTKDPELENASQALSSPPNLSTNQLSSIVKLMNGQRVIIGGLINNVTQDTGQMIPKIGENRWFNRIFGKTNNIQRTEELIIIITPSIIY